MRFTTKILKLTFFFIAKLNQIAQENKHYKKLYAYYAFPALMGMLIIFTLVRLSTSLFPNVRLTINGAHIHHFISGIFILILAGYLALWIESKKGKYTLALLYGSGIGFVLDEFYVWFRLDGSPISHSEYNAIVFVAAILLLILLFPAGIRGITKLRQKSM